MRLFAALPLSSEAIERLTAFRLRNGTPSDGLRWSPPEQWHITLQFYGSVEPPLAECLESQLLQLRASAPRIAVESFGLFPAKGILFASVEVTPELMELQQRVTECGNACGFLAESRPFRPHITLARSKGPIGHASLRRMAHPTPPSFGPTVQWMPRECLLLESILRPQGAEYSVRLRAMLQPATQTGEAEAGSVVA